MKSLLLPDVRSSARSLASLARGATSGDYRTAPPKPSARGAGLALYPPGEQSRSRAELSRDLQKSLRLFWTSRDRRSRSVTKDAKRLSDHSPEPRLATFS
jgi:hypothetical protein